MCKLVKSLYGLKQAGRQWQKELSNKLLEYGFTRSTNDHYLFKLQRELHRPLYVVIYVDDILIVSPAESSIQDVKEYLHRLFNIKDMGPMKYFLGIEITRSNKGIVMT